VPTITNFDDFGDTKPTFLKPAAMVTFGMRILPLDVNLYHK